MSDMNGWNAGDLGDDPFAPGVVEDAIVRSLTPGAPATPSASLVRTLADAYRLPPAAEDVLARSRATLARRAEALGSERHKMSSSDTRPDSAWSITQPPQLPPNRRVSHFATVWRTVAAVLVVALLGGGFFAVLHGMQLPGGRPKPTGTHTPVPATATPSTTPGAPTPTTIPPQPPAPAGVYVTAPGNLFLLNPSTGAIQQRYPFTWSSQGFPGTPVVANGMVYFTYQSTVTSAGESDVVALSATSGVLLWRTQTAARLAQLTEADGVLYGGTDGTSTGSDTFYAVRASDGSVLWTFRTPTLRPPVVVTGGVVYLMDQPSNPTAQHVHALRASDGSPLWDSALPQGCASADDAVVDAGMVFVACHALFDMGQGGNGSVYGLRASDGRVLWHYTTNGEPTTGLAAGAGLVYVSPSGKNAAGVNVAGLYALDETSGAVRWQVANGDGYPQLDGTTVYAGVGSSLAAFSAAQGTMLWTYSEANQQRDLGAPVIADGVVYDVLNEQVVAISAANGTLLWHSPTLASQQQGLSGLSVVTGG